MVLVKSDSRCMLFLSSSPQRALCVIGRLGREKKTMHAAGMMGRGKRRTFPSSSALTFLVYFFNVSWNRSGASAEKSDPHV